MKPLDPMHRPVVEQFIGTGAMDAVFAHMKLQYFEDFVATHVTDAALREAIHAKVNALEDLRATLTSYAKPHHWNAGR